MQIIKLIHAVQNWIHGCMVWYNNFRIRISDENLYVNHIKPHILWRTRVHIPSPLLGRTYSNTLISFACFAFYARSQPLNMMLKSTANRIYELHCKVAILRSSISYAWSRTASINSQYKRALLMLVFCLLSELNWSSFSLGLRIVANL